MHITGTQKTDRFLICCHVWLLPYTDEDGSDEESTHTEDGEDIEERPKVKRTRTAYSNYQLDQLELVFSQTHYPDVFLREELSARLGISESRLQV